MCIFECSIVYKIVNAKPSAVDSGKPAAFVKCVENPVSFFLCPRSIRAYNIVTIFVGKGARTSLHTQIYGLMCCCGATLSESCLGSGVECEIGWNEGGMVFEDMRLYFVFGVIDYFMVGFVFFPTGLL